MSKISSYALSLLAQRHLSAADHDWIVGQIDAIGILFDNPGWLYMADAEHTTAQVGYLIGLMDLERNDRLEALSMIMGYPLKTSDDARITRWEFSVLIDYYLNGDGQQFNETIGYTSATVTREEKRFAREVAKQAKTTKGQSPLPLGS